MQQAFTQRHLLRYPYTGLISGVDTLLAEHQPVDVHSRNGIKSSVFVFKWILPWSFFQRSSCLHLFWSDPPVLLQLSPPAMTVASVLDISQCPSLSVGSSNASLGWQPNLRRCLPCDDLQTSSIQMFSWAHSVLEKAFIFFFFLMFLHVSTVCSHTTKI